GGCMRAGYDEVETGLAGPLRSDDRDRHAGERRRYVTELGVGQALPGRGGLEHLGGARSMYPERGLQIAAILDLHVVRDQESLEVLPGALLHPRVEVEANALFHAEHVGVGYDLAFAGEQRRIAAASGPKR